jgi:hypothetical protein
MFLLVLIILIFITMSVVQNPITGRTRGKFSNAIFSKWKQLNTIRAKPLQVKQPNTQGQLDQRTAFSIIVRYARMVLTMLRFSFKYSASTMSEFNFFIKKNIDCVDIVTGKIAAAFLELLEFSSGPEAGLFDTAITSASAAAVVVTWDDTYMADSREVGDKVILFVYNSTEDTMSAIDNNILFSAGTGSFPLTSTPSDNLYIYAAVCTANMSRFSPSQYIGTESVA